MKKLEESLTRREKDVLLEIIKGCKKSDQEIARKLNTSRQTVFKIRKKLEIEGFIRKYLSIIDFSKLGFNVHAVIMYRWKDYSKKKELEEVTNFIKNQPEVILFIKGEGIGNKTDLIISVHEDLKDYESFIRKLKISWKDNVEDLEIFLSSTESIAKDYDFSSFLIKKLESGRIF
ncbi:MAG: Lrp/AsnC family transcriptional regulator [Candidatus Pacearchaeota archaeon]